MQFEGCGDAVLSENLASRDAVDQLMAERACGRYASIRRCYEDQMWVKRRHHTGSPTPLASLGARSEVACSLGNGGHQFVQRQRLAPAHLNGTCSLKMTGIWHRLRR